jgi:hypothetical protein
VPTALYDVANGVTPAPYARSYPSGVCWIWLDKYVESLWKNRRQASHRQELLGLLKRSRDIKAFAYWSLRDPLPFLAEIALHLTFARRWLQPRRFKELTGFRMGASPFSPDASIKTPHTQ